MMLTTLIRPRNKAKLIRVIAVSTAVFMLALSILGCAQPRANRGPTSTPTNVFTGQDAERLLVEEDLLIIPEEQGMKFLGLRMPYSPTGHAFYTLNYSNGTHLVTLTESVEGSGSFQPAGSVIVKRESDMQIRGGKQAQYVETTVKQSSKTTTYNEMKWTEGRLGIWLMAENIDEAYLTRLAESLKPAKS